MGHRLSEWCSKGPILEEDLALSNIALDLLGQASALLRYAGETEGKGRTEDDLAYKRFEQDFRCNLIVQLPKGDFGFTITRQFLYSSFLTLFYKKLQQSKDATLAALAAKSLKEVKYHLRHSVEWMYRLGDGTEESNRRVQQALEDIWPYTGELFEMDEVDAILIAEGIAPDLATLRPEWDKQVNEVLHTATLERPTDGHVQRGSRKGNHTEHLGFLLAELQFLPRAYPDAKW